MTSGVLINDIGRAMKQRFPAESEVHQGKNRYWQEKREGEVALVLQVAAYFPQCQNQWSAHVRLVPEAPPGHLQEDIL